MQLRQAYERDGYIFPLKVMTTVRAAEHRAMFESVEAAYAEDAVASRIVKGFANSVLPFVDEIMRLPSLLGPVKAILGEDLLVMGANFFIKEPETPTFVSWHQDLTYWGYDGASEVTAWVALTAATPDQGCMRFIPGSHQREIVGHSDTFDESNMLSRGQEISLKVNEVAAVDAVLEILPGEVGVLGLRQADGEGVAQQVSVEGVERLGGPDGPAARRGDLRAAKAHCFVCPGRTRPRLVSIDLARAPA